MGKTHQFAKSTCFSYLQNQVNPIMILGVKSNQPGEVMDNNTIKLVENVRHNILLTLAYVQSVDHNPETDHELHAARIATEEILNDSIVEIGEFLDNNQTHHRN